MQQGECNRQPAEPPVRCHEELLHAGAAVRRQETNVISYDKRRPIPALKDQFLSSEQGPQPRSLQQNGLPNDHIKSSA